MDVYNVLQILSLTGVLTKLHRQSRGYDESGISADRLRDDVSLKASLADCIIDVDAIATILARQSSPADTHRETTRYIQLVLAHVYDGKIFFFSNHAPHIKATNRSLLFIIRYHSIHIP
jgi:hypothetical protein